MASITLLNPNPVTDPADSISINDIKGVRTRKLDDSFSNQKEFHRKNREQYEDKNFLSYSEAMQIDVKHIVYDIIYNKAEAKIFAIGPNQHNTERFKCLTGFRLIIRGSEESYFCPVTIDASAEKYCIAKTKNMPNWVQKAGVSKVYSVFSNFGEIGPHDYTNSRVNQKSIAVTLNRNNQPSWIKDWLVHHYLTGIEFFAIYDNGSSNVAEVLKEIRSIPFDIEVLYITWEYPFGPQRAPQYKFSQAAMLQHAMFLFPSADYVLNVDTDELVFSEDLNAVISNAQPMVGPLPDVVYFRRYDVVTSESRLIGRWPKYRAKEFHQAVLPARKRAQKYLVRPASARHAQVHTCSTKKGSVSICALDSLILCFHYLPLTTGFQSDARKFVGLPTKLEEVKLKAEGHALFQEKNERIAATPSSRRILELADRFNRAANILFFVPGAKNVLRVAYKLRLSSLMSKLRVEIQSKL